MKKNELISYACSFISFLLKDAKIAEGIEKIILFGSVATGQFDAESDIDIFVETKDKKLAKKVEKRLDLFDRSETAKRWKLMGLKNPIRLKIGQLDKWKSLKRSIISAGITLFGKYAEPPEGKKFFTLFRVSTAKLARNQKVKLWRKLYGYAQKVGKTVYKFKGKIKEFNGQKLGRGVFVVPAIHTSEVVKILKQARVDYTILEIWSDSI